MAFDEAEESNGKLIMLGTVVDSLKAASSGSTPFFLRIWHAPGFTVLEVVPLAPDGDSDNGNTCIDGGNHLEQAPRPAENLSGLHDGENVAVPHVA